MTHDYMNDVRYWMYIQSPHPSRQLIVLERPRGVRFAPLLLLLLRHLLHQQLIDLDVRQVLRIYGSIVISVNGQSLNFFTNY